MITEKIGKLTIERYEHVDEMPIDLYNLVNEYALLDAEIGSTMDDVIKRFNRMDLLHAKSEWDQLLQERKNLHSTFYNILNRNNFKGLQYGCFIKTVDGIAVDHGMEKLKKLLSLLSAQGLTMAEVKREVNESKKNPQRTSCSISEAF